MPLLNLDRMCEGLEAGDWAGLLHNWDRALRAGTTRSRFPFSLRLGSRILRQPSQTERPARPGPAVLLLPRHGLMRVSPISIGLRLSMSTAGPLYMLFSSVEYEPSGWAWKPLRFPTLSMNMHSVT